MFRQWTSSCVMAERGILSVTATRAMVLNPGLPTDSLAPWNIHMVAGKIEE